MCFSDTILSEKMKFWGQVLSFINYMLWYINYIFDAGGKKKSSFW